MLYLPDKSNFYFLCKKCDTTYIPRSLINPGFCRKKYCVFDHKPCILCGSLTCRRVVLDYFEYDVTNWVSNWSPPSSPIDKAVITYTTIKDRYFFIDDPDEGAVFKQVIYSRYLIYIYNTDGWIVGFYENSTMQGALEYANHLLEGGRIEFDSNPDQARHPQFQKQLNHEQSPLF